MGKMDSERGIGGRECPRDADLFCLHLRQTFVLELVCIPVHLDGSYLQFNQVLNEEGWLFTDATQSFLSWVGWFAYEMFLTASYI